MSYAPQPALWIIDDDLMTREVLALLADDAHYQATTFESGEGALQALETSAPPAAFLIDMQMPGISGDALATSLRAACPPGTRILAMSGTGIPPEKRRQFDHFLLKPFSAEELDQLLNQDASPSHIPTPATIPHLDPDLINPATFAAFRQTMPPAQLRALYTMCLDDVDARLATVRQASQDRDNDAFRRAAHSIKGGCGMVGAVDLARRAAGFEQNGMPVVHTLVPFQEFLEASARLRGMLGRVLNDL